MNKDNNSLEKNNLDYQSYLSVFSHKLKNPVHSIGINLEVIRTKVNKALGEKSGDIQKHLDIVATELSNMNRITHCFSEFLLVKESKKSKILVHKMIQELFDILKIKLPKSHRLIDYNNSGNKLTIIVNKEDISRALYEIVVNAVEATQDDNQVNIRVIQSGDFVEILISDTGQGISKKDQKRVFDLFYTTKKGRIGCGLSFAKRLIEVNQGQISINSQINRGTTILSRFHLAG